MRFSIIFSSLLFFISLTACQTGDILSTASPANIQNQNQNQGIRQTSNGYSAAPIPSIAPALAPKQVLTPIPAPVPTSQYTQQNFATGKLDSQVSQNSDIIIVDPLVEQIHLLKSVPPRTQKTYLINGLMSAIPFIGFGFRNLHKKMPEAQLYSYLSPVESVAVILPKVMKDIQAAYAKDPNVSINLIGISLGADFVSIVAEKLHRKNIPVNYLGIVDGTSLRPVHSNVKKVDNLTCTYLDCVRGRVRLAKGNTTTIFIKKKYKSSHIPLGNNNELHNRVIAQSRS